jgi:hypothetical protein
MEPKYDSKIFLEICVSNMLNDLSINAYLFELFTVLRQFELIYEPVWDIVGVPLFVIFEFGGLCG